jgi:ribonuclease HI
MPSSAKTHSAPAPAAAPSPAAKPSPGLSPAEAVRRAVREARATLPAGVTLPALLLALANRPDVARLLAEAFPGAAPVDLRRALATASGLVRALEEWTDQPAAAAAATRKRAAAKKAAGGDSDTDKDTDSNADSGQTILPPAAPILVMDPDGAIRPIALRPSSSVLSPSAIAPHHAVKVQVDGASKGNPGPSAAGIVITDLEGEVIYEEGICLGEMTNNAAEYRGLIRALEILAENGRPLAYVFSDSLLMVNQMNLEWQVKHPDIRRLFSQAQILKRRLPKFEIRHVPREKNKRADQLANRAIKEARRDSALRGKTNSG